MIPAYVVAGMKALNNAPVEIAVTLHCKPCPCGRGHLEVFERSRFRRAHLPRCLTYMLMDTPVVVEA